MIIFLVTAVTGVGCVVVIALVAGIAIILNGHVGACKRPVLVMDRE